MATKERTAALERQGYEAGIKGESLTKNQHFRSDEKAAFLRGYYKALMEKKEK